MAKNPTVKILGDASSLESALRAAETGLGKLGGAAANAGKAVAAGMAAVAAVGVTALAKGFADGMEREQIGDKIAAQLKLSDPQQREFMTASADLYSEAWGDSLGEVAAKMAEAQRAFGDVDNLDALTRSAFAIADTFDGDVNSTLQDAKELMESFGVTGEQAMDLLAAASKGTTAEVRDEMSSAIREYGNVFESLGLNADRTLGILSTFGEGGAMQLDKVADAMKEFTLRGTDMSALSATAFESMGKDQKLYADLILEGGDAASDALFGVLRGLEEIEDPTEQMAAAVALFGSPFEDLGMGVPEFIAAMRSTDGVLGETAGAADALAETIGGNLRTRFESFKRQGLMALAEVMEQRVIPVVDEMFTRFQEHWPRIRDFVVDASQRVRDIVEEHWPTIRDAIVETVDTIREKFDEYWPIIHAVIETVTSEVMRLVEKHWPQIRDTIVDAVEMVQAGVERVIAVVTYIWERWGETLTDYVTEAWENIQQAIGGALDIIQGVFRAFKALFEGDWRGLWDAVKQILDGAKQVLLAALDQMWNAMKTAAKLAWDVVKTEVWDALKALPGLFLQAHVLLWNAAWDLIGKAKDGMVAGLGLLPGIVTGALMAFPRIIFDAVGDLFSLGQRLFTRLKDGIADALSDLPGIILDKVLGPLDEIAAKIGEIIGAVIPGVGGSGGTKLPGSVPKDPDAALLAHIVNLNKPGPRAHGGPVNAGRPYLVGEHGPELFTPGSAGGSIMSNSEMQGATINVHVAGSNASPDEIGAAVVWSLRMAG